MEGTAEKDRTKKKKLIINFYNIDPDFRFKFLQFFYIHEAFIEIIYHLNK